jgi:uncharacterized membrane protein
MTQAESEVLRRISDREAASVPAFTKPGSRLTSIDALRGAVMIIMALDHIRDFFHADAMVFSPTDLTQTTPFLFLTRWITHFCLPVFMFAAGLGAFLSGQRKTRAQLSRFLLTRGLWFVVLELTVMQFSYNFNFSSRFLVLLLILWIFGLCMMAMAALVYLPVRWLAVLSVAIIVLHNCLDGMNAMRLGSWGWAWRLLHQPGVVPVAGRPVLVTYTLVPWIGVMAACFCFGQVFLLQPQARRRIMLRLGFGMTIGFFLLRAINHYGDPIPWSQQKSLVFTVLSFFNCTKYPGSLDFLLMTLGPALLALAYLDRRSFTPTNPLIVFGRVPLFYFILHFYLIHAIVVVAAFLRYGSAAAGFIFNPVPAMGGPRQLFPADFGYRLWVTYGVWILTLALLYPLCRWFAKIKATRRNRWLSYL